MGVGIGLIYCFSGGKRATPENTTNQNNNSSGNNILLDLTNIAPTKKIKLLDSFEIPYSELTLYLLLFFSHEIS